MDTKLYQEETEIGGGAETLTPEKRAKMVEELIAGSKFRVVRGVGWQNPRCIGCALGALAYALGTTGARNHTEAVVGATRTGLVSIREAGQLECGFEGWPDSIGGVPAAPFDPFYQLGRRLRAQAPYQKKPWQE